MGNRISSDGVFHYGSSYRAVKEEKYNTRVALWQLPYDARYRQYDIDQSKWFEAINKNYDNEIEKAEENLHMSFSRYKVYTKSVEYEDGTFEEVSKYPNGNVVKVSKGFHHVFVNIKNKLGQLVAEKVFNNDSKEGCKYIYQNITQGDNTFVITKVYKYDTTKNKASDTVNYGYTSSESTLTKGCDFVKEYYSLNGRQVEAKKISDFEYRVKDANNKILTFKVE